INEAKTFKENWKKAKVKGIKKYNPETKTEVIINMQVIHPLSQNSYYFGEQISPEQDPALNNFLKKYPK
ncbi:MAG TPA: hypothetical protein P5250_07680, partial [Bacteroidales bacterium]|nr:hypothetical protein [Bacteroidales bacterium]